MNITNFAPSLESRHTGLYGLWFYLDAGSARHLPPLSLSLSLLLLLLVALQLVFTITAFISIVIYSIHCCHYYWYFFTMPTLMNHLCHMSWMCCDSVVHSDIFCPSWGTDPPPLFFSRRFLPFKGFLGGVAPLLTWSRERGWRMCTDCKALWG